MGNIFFPEMDLIVSLPLYSRLDVLPSVDRSPNVELEPENLTICGLNPFIETLEKA